MCLMAAVELAKNEKKVDGCRRSPYEIQVRVEFYNQDSTYGLRVLKCRQNGLIVGMELEDEACSFPSLASSVFPEADTKAWE